MSAVGDNLILGVIERGGTFKTGLVVSDVEGLVDGDMNTYANKFLLRAISGWRNEGLWWELDSEPSSGLTRYSSTSTTKARGLPAPRCATEARDLPFWFFQTVGHDPRASRLRPLGGSRQRAKSLRRSRAALSLSVQAAQSALPVLARLPDFVRMHARAAELMLFSPGYQRKWCCARALSTWARSSAMPGQAIKHLSWDADLPVGTRMQLRLRSGVQLSEEYTYHNKIGEVVLKRSGSARPKCCAGRSILR